MNILRKMECSILLQGKALETKLRYSGKIGIVNIPSYDSLQIDSKRPRVCRKILNSL